MDSSGSAVAVWLNEDGSSPVVQSSRWNPQTSTWSAAQTLGAAPSSSKPQVYVGSAGDAIALWPDTAGIYAAVEPAGAPQFDAAELLTGPALSAVAAVNANGDIAIAWQGSNGIFVKTRPKGGVWGADETVTTTATGVLLPPTVAMSLNGDATVAFQMAQLVRRRRPMFAVVNYEIYVSHRSGLLGAWDAPAALGATNPTTAHQLGVAMDDQGHSVLVADQISNPGAGLEAVVRLPDGTYSSPTLLANRNAVLGGVVSDQNGALVATWFAPTGKVGDVEAASGDIATNVWGSVTTLTTASASINSQTYLTGNQDGGAVASWVLTDALTGAAVGVQSAVLPAPAGVWQQPLDICPAGSNTVSLGSVQMNPAGVLMGLWDVMPSAGMPWLEVISYKP